MTDQPSNRFGHATEQLDEAIELFLEGQFLSALRLAGVADEILAKVLSDSGKEHFLHWKYGILEPVLTLPRTPLSKEDFIEDENLALTAIKHMEPASDLSITLVSEDDAYSMILRGCENYDRLGLPRTAKMLELENWFFEHVVGLEYDS